MHAGWLVPHAQESTPAAGDVLFRKGDRGDRLYYLVSGRIGFDDIGVEIGPGTLFGEIAFFMQRWLPDADRRGQIGLHAAVDR